MKAIHKPSAKLIAVYTYIKDAVEAKGVMFDVIKSMKLPYIAFGFYGAQNDGAHLFPDTIQAWKHGPVMPALYKLVKASFAGLTSDYVLSAKECASIDLVLDIYGRRPSFGLVSATHSPTGPWREVYAEGENNEIPKESIISHYKHLLNTAHRVVANVEDYRELART